MLQALEEIAFRPFLPVRQRLEHAVLVEETRDLVEALLKTRFGSNRAHGGPPVIPRQYPDSANSA